MAATVVVVLAAVLAAAAWAYCLIFSEYWHQYFRVVFDSFHNLVEFQYTLKKLFVVLKINALNLKTVLFVQYNDFRRVLIENCVQQIETENIGRCSCLLKPEHFHSIYIFEEKKLLERPKITICALWLHFCFNFCFWLDLVWFWSFSFFFPFSIFIFFFVCFLFDCCVSFVSGFSLVSFHKPVGNLITSTTTTTATKKRQTSGHNINALWYSTPNERQRDKKKEEGENENSETKKPLRKSKCKFPILFMQEKATAAIEKQHILLNRAKHKNNIRQRTRTKNKKKIQ